MFGAAYYLFVNQLPDARFNNCRIHSRNSMVFIELYMHLKPAPACLPLHLCLDTCSSVTLNLSRLKVTQATPEPGFWGEQMPKSKPTCGKSWGSCEQLTDLRVLSRGSALLGGMAILGSRTWQCLALTKVIPIPAPTRIWYWGRTLLGSDLRPVPRSGV